MAALTTNSVVHGAGSGALRIRAESDRIVCEVHDRGWLNDPLAARPIPRSPAAGGSYSSTNARTSSLCTPAPTAPAFAATSPDDRDNAAGTAHSLMRSASGDVFPMTHHVDCVAILEPAAKGR
ncbi:hypothetical protein [Streptomyces sp. NPDC006334]|uniref:hypothetical protein n=1 Tax=Streptomyces sp. NPDC006334 TaxID=3156754 RepID=UPI0033BCEF3C